MSTQETELPDCQERVGLKRKLTGPPRLLLGKSKSKERLDGKSQRRQREAKCCDSTPDNNDQENDGINNESTDISHQSPQKAPEESKTLPDAPEDTTGNLVTLEESESKDENVKTKMEMSRSASKTSIKRTFSSLLVCGKRKESERTKHKTSNPQEAHKNRNDMCSSTCENKLIDAKIKEVPNGKSKKKVFFMVWPISKRSATSNVDLGKGCKEEGSSMDFQEITPKGWTFKKIYRIFPRRKKTPPIDQFECIAPSGSQNEVADQLDPSPTTAMDNSTIKKEENQKEELEMKAENVPETFTFSAEVSVNPNIDSDHIHEKREIWPDQVVSMNKKETDGVLDSEVSELPGTSSGADRLVKNEEPIENDVKCRPVITIERAYSSEEENMNETPQFDGLTVNGSWQHLNINHFTNSTLHPSDLSHSRCNETLLIQTAISMVQAAIRGAVEQFTIEQQHNQISLDPS